jgi:hypothetical protein
LTYLGKFGIIQLNDFSIGFLSGLFDKYTYFSSSVTSSIVYNEKEIQEFSKILRDATVDLLLSCEWSNAILNNLKQDQMPKTRPLQVSPPVGKLVKQMNPKYHFASTENVFYERFHTWLVIMGHVVGLLPLEILDLLRKIFMRLR